MRRFLFRGMVSGGIGPARHGRREKTIRRQQGACLRSVSAKVSRIVSGSDTLQTEPILG